MLLLLIVQTLSHVWLFVTPWTSACWASLPSPSPSPGACSNSRPWSQWCHPTVSYSDPLPYLPSVFARIRIFSNELALHIRWPKYWSFKFSICLSSEYSGLISFRIDRFDFAVHQNLKTFDYIWEFKCYVDINDIHPVLLFFCHFWWYCIYDFSHMLDKCFWY